MFFSKLANAAVIVFALAFLGLGSGLVAQWALADPHGQGETAYRTAPRCPEKGQGQSKKIEEFLATIKSVDGDTFAGSKVTLSRSVNGKDQEITLTAAEDVVLQLGEITLPDRKELLALLPQEEWQQVRVKTDGRKTITEIHFISPKLLLAQKRTHSANNLKQIALAMYGYHDDNGTLPAAAICDKNGKPLLSCAWLSCRTWHNRTFTMSSNWMSRGIAHTIKSLSLACRPFMRFLPHQKNQAKPTIASLSAVEPHSTSPRE